MREAADQRRAEARLELVEAGAVDDARDHLPDVVGGGEARRHHAEDLVGVVSRLLRRLHRRAGRPRPVQPRHRLPRQRQRVRVVVGEVVGDAGEPGVHVAAAEILRAHLLAGRRLHQRRAGEKDRALLLHDDGHVRHRRHVGPAGGAGAHDHRDLRDAAGAQVGLVVEDAPEVVAVGEDLVLVRQVRPARIHQVDARQPALGGDLLRAQVLLHRQRVVGAALHGGVVRHHHHLLARRPGRCRRSAPPPARPRRRARARPSRRSRGTARPRRAAPPPARAAASCRAPRAAPPPARRRRRRRARPPPRSRRAPPGARRGWRGRPPPRAWRRRR